MRQDLPLCHLLIKELCPAQHQYTLPNATQVAAIIVGDDNLFERAQQDIIIQTHGDNLQNVPDTAGFYDPLQYPILLPYGSYGWDINTSSSIGQNISCRAFYAHKLQIRNGYKSLLLRGGRLLQQYVVDNWVKIETQKLRYIRDNQTIIRAELYQGLQDSLQAGETIAGNVGRRIVLPASYIGSPIDKYHRYQDAMALVQKYGKPDLFITMTCNPTWDEITRELHLGQTAQDRPDLTTRIFRAKCEELKKDALERGVLGKVIAPVHVIEFQKRGLPHVHMLIIMEDTDKLSDPDLYDGIVRAEIPDLNIEPRLHDAVSRHMVHGPCGLLNPRCSCMKEGKCSKRYPQHFCYATVQGNDSYPIYRRRDNGIFVIKKGHQVDNRWVVPYNPWLLKKYNCHINVEICSSIKSVKYLYKYIHKGPNRVRMEVRPRINSNNNEIMQFVDAHWVCPQEAMWRIFKFPQSKIYPSVYALQIHLPNRQQVTFYGHQPIEDVLSNETT